MLIFSLPWWDLATRAAGVLGFAVAGWRFCVELSRHRREDTERETRETLEAAAERELTVLIEKLNDKPTESGWVYIFPDSGWALGAELGVDRGVLVGENHLGVRLVRLKTLPSRSRRVASQPRRSLRYARAS
jgi:hypothetical protein